MQRETARNAVSTGVGVITDNLGGPEVSVLGSRFWVLGGSRDGKGMPSLLVDTRGGYSAENMLVCVKINVRIRKIVDNS